jgi:hypothetical protein
MAPHCLFKTEFNIILPSEFLVQVPLFSSDFPSKVVYACLIPSHQLWYISHPLHRPLIILITVAGGHNCDVTHYVLLPSYYFLSLTFEYFLFPDSFSPLYVFHIFLFSFCVQWISHALLLSYPILHLHTVAVFYCISPWQRCNLRPFFSYILFRIKLCISWAV